MLAACILLAGMTSCSKKEDTPTVQAESSKDKSSADKTSNEAKKESEEELDYANMSAEDLVKDFIDKKELSDEDWLWLVSTYRYVPINDKLELEGNITSKAFSILDEKDISYGSSKEGIKKLVKSEYPQLRGKGYEFMGTLFGLSYEELSLAKEGIKTEKDPFVLKYLIAAVGNNGTDPEVGAFLLDMAKHENAGVRAAAATWIGTSSNKGMEGAVETLIELMKDKDLEVAGSACGSCGALHDDSFVEPIKEILNDDTKYELHEDCIYSLAEMWLDYPVHQYTSEPAYRATLEYFKKTPRTDDVPYWGTITDISHIAESNFEAWKNKASYYNAEEIVAVMKEILQDPKVNWIGRSGAIDVILAHGGKEAFESLEPIINGLSDEDARFVQESYQRKKLDN